MRLPADRPLKPPRARRPVGAALRGRTRKKRGKTRIRTAATSSQELALEMLANEALAEVREKNPALYEVLASYSTAIKGEFDAVLHLSARGIAELELVRRKLIQAIEDQGVLIQQPIADRSGKIFFSVKDNPALFHLPKIYETLGMTAKDTLLSRQSRGETAKNAEQAALLQARRVRLDKGDPSKIPPPQQQRQRAIETSLVEP